MSLEADAIDKILQLAESDSFKIGERHYTSKKIIPIKEPTVSPVQVHTLTGLAALLSDKASDFLDHEYSYMIHVVDHQKVQVLAQGVTDWCERQSVILAECLQTEGFSFSRFHAPDEFIINFQSLFVPSEEAQNLLKIVSNLAAEAVATSQDNGVSQTATIQTSVASRGTVELKPRWTLAPFRTFLEIDQPPSEFLFRLQNTSTGKPGCALFEADGGRWKLNAIKGIKTWLESSIDKEKFPVIA